MRAFFAIELPEAVKDVVSEDIEKLQSMDINCKLVSKENLHITLLFLGDIEEEDLQDRINLLEGELGKIESFFLSIEDLGFFYNRRGLVRVIWMDIVKNAKRVEDISRILYGYFEDILEENNLIKEHPSFKPHLTLGRIKNINRHQNNELKNWGKDFNKGNNKSKFKVEKISVIKSELISQGPVYTLVKNIKLK